MAKPKKAEKGKAIFIPKPRVKRGVHSKPRGAKTGVFGRHHR